MVFSEDPVEPVLLPQPNSLPSPLRFSLGGTKNAPVRSAAHRKVLQELLQEIRFDYPRLILA